MILKGHKIVLSSCFLVAAGILGADAHAQEGAQKQPQLQPPAQEESGRGTLFGTEENQPNPSASGQSTGTNDRQVQADPFTETRLGLPLLKNIVLDQKAVWTSPKHLRLNDANWIIPFGAITAAS